MVRCAFARNLCYKIFNTSLMPIFWRGLASSRPPSLLSLCSQRDSTQITPAVPVFNSTTASLFGDVNPVLAQQNHVLKETSPLNRIPLNLDKSHIQ